MAWSFFIGIVRGKVDVCDATGMLVVIRRGVLNSEESSVLFVGRCGVDIGRTKGRKGVLVGGNIEVGGRLGDPVLSSPNIAIAFLLAASLATGAAAPEPVVNPVDLTGVAIDGPGSCVVVGSSSPNIASALFLAASLAMGAGAPEPVVKPVVFTGVAMSMWPP